MGGCWSGTCSTDNLKVTNPFSGFSISGRKSRLACKDGKDVGGGNSSKVSATSVPPTPRSEGEILQSSKLKSFAFNDLRAATRNFRPDSVLGEGGFGSVFKGWIDENTMSATKPGTGMVIAVKRLNQDSYQGHREWLTEVNYLGQLYHPNLVKLVGYCLEDEQRLLVYEFMSRGSLENHLFRRGAYFRPLSWNLRLKVALGAAKGLAFLHKTKVIFRDFKAANILLDMDYNAKLSDFGLAKDGPTGDMSHVSTRVMGTHGYAAPEYLATGHLTEKSDVYSFGVVLLEMLTGKRAVDKNRPTGEHNLVEWAKPFLNHKRKFDRVLDLRIQGQMGGAQKAGFLALKCLCSEARYRPTMNEVVHTLEQLHSTKTSTRNPQASQNGSSRHSLRSSSPRRRVVENKSQDASSTGNRRHKATAKGNVMKYPRPSASPLYT